MQPPAQGPGPPWRTPAAPPPATPRRSRRVLVVLTVVGVLAALLVTGIVVGPGKGADEPRGAARTCEAPAASVPAARFAPSTVWQFGTDLQTTDRPPAAPARVPGLTDVVSLSTAGRTNIAVRSDGSVWVWGSGDFGLLADGRSEKHDAVQPIRVEGLPRMESVHSVGATVFALATDGSVWGWGDANLALLQGGTSGRGNVNRPVRIVGLDDVASVARGPLTAVALHRDGSVVAWGLNLTKVVGPRAAADRSTVRNLSGVIGVASTVSSAAAVLSDGTVCVWGGNPHGELGRSDTGLIVDGPQPMPGLADIGQVASTDNTLLALDHAGRVHTWGRKSAAMGAGVIPDGVSPTPSVVQGLPPVAGIAAFKSTAYGITADGELWGWGSSIGLGGYGRLGDGQPIRIPLPAAAVAVVGAFTGTFVMVAGSQVAQNTASGT